MINYLKHLNSSLALTQRLFSPVENICEIGENQWKNLWFIMLDLKLLRENPQALEAKLKTKDPAASLSEIMELDTLVRKRKTEVEELKSKRKSASKQIGEMKRKGEDTGDLMAEIGGIGDTIAEMDALIKHDEEKLFELLGHIPNLPDPVAKVSFDPQENVEIKTVGEKPTFSFQMKNHVELNETLDLFDFKRGAKVSGSGWVTYKGFGAQLEWALLQYMMSIHIKNGFTQWMTPLLVRPEIMHGSAQLPKFKGQFYELNDDDNDLYLIPTAETALCGLHRDEIMEKNELPLKYVAYTPCFRREAGAAGAQERGLIRVHQFNKVELFAFCKPEESEQMFETIVASAEEILQGLGLHYRNMMLVTGDMSFSASKTIDIEVWLPGQDRYYEVSSVSHCSDFQARRSKIRYKDDEGKTQFVHTLNGSGLATSRLMVGLLENNQQEDGSVLIPEVLRPYLGGVSALTPKEIHA